MDIYERLIKDHDKQKNLANQIMETSGNSDERRRLFEQFKAEAVSHANAEEQTLYAVLIEDPNSQEQARHSVSEHQGADELINELSDMDMSSAGWIQKFEKLIDELEHHIEEEEQDVFKLAKDLVSGADATEMSRMFDKRKQQEEEHV
jgi:iron-sulfur cluster repair protein YtfE (RIC family)